MNIAKTVDKLKKKYPGKNIIVNEDGEYQEILCELDPTSDHKDRSLAIVVVGKSKEHFHEKTTEIYGVLKGKLTLYIDGKKHFLEENEKIEIKPGRKHWCKGDKTWFYTYYTPGWTP